MTRHTDGSTARREVSLGLAAFSAKWFQEVGLQDGDLSAAVRSDYAAMVQALERAAATVVAPGVISTDADVRRAATAFRAGAIDALVLVHSMWSEDQPLMALLEHVPDTPVLLWNFYPTDALPTHLTVNDMLRRSGTVGMLQGSAVLQRRRVPFELVSGTPADAHLRRELAEFAAALAVRRRLRGMAAGRIAGRCEVMTGTFVDAPALRARLGVRLVEISAADYAAACGRVPADDVARHAAALRERFPVVGVSEPSLNLACRNTLALDLLAAEHELGALAVQDLDPTLHRLTGTRPCLCPPRCAAHGVPVAMESDLNTGLGLLAGMVATGAPGLYTEIFTFDATADLLLMGHAGVNDPALAAPGTAQIIPDEEYRHSDAVEGAAFQFVMAAGPVTCVSLYDAGDRYRMTVFDGESQGAPGRLDGYTHAVVRTRVPVTELLPRLVRRGTTQHVAVVPGRAAGTLQKWARLAGVEFNLEH